MLAERLARRFHDLYEKLAPEYGYETKEETRQFDPDSPNGQLMIAVCRIIYSEIVQNLAEEIRLYFVGLNYDITRGEPSQKKE
jgi:hypothetical protein